MGGVRVALIESDPALRALLAELINSDPDLEVVSSFGDAQEARPRIGSRRPDVVVADLDCPAMATQSTLGRLIQASGSARLVLIAEESDEAKLRALTAGAKGFVSKETITRWLLGGVHAAANDLVWIDGRIIHDVEREVAYLRRRTQATEAQPVRLTARQQELLGLAARGWTNERIARALRRSIHTINHHFTRIFAEMGVSNRTEAVARAQAQGLLPAATLDHEEAQNQTGVVSPHIAARVE